MSDDDGASSAGSRGDVHGPPWRALVGLLAAVALIAAALLIVSELRRVAAIQDCVASGRTNCAPIESSGG
ncbi:MAG: hypothetical protein AB7F35_09220 [Acetobacteraceae bacterium]